MMSERAPAPLHARPAQGASPIRPGFLPERSTAGPTAPAPLPSAIRSAFEPQFGHDFSQVRIHDDAAAGASARAMGAQAWTNGDDIFLGDGAPRPETLAGRRLVAHELTHVVQQRSAARGATNASPSRLDQPEPDALDRAERQADELARVADESRPGGGTPVRLTSSALPASAVQRKPAAGSATAGAGAGAGSAADPTEHVAGTLYARAPDGTPLPPSLDDIEQGGLSDCFLMAALAAMVNTDPMLIRSMIAYGPNGTYTVTFKGIGFLSSAKQTVTADFAIGKHAHLGPRKALWPLVIERAYAQEKGGLAEINKGGNPGGVVDDMINDSPSRFDPREKTADYIMGKVAKGKAKKWPMTILAPKQADATKEKMAMTTTISGLHFWHSYAIIDVDAKGNRIKLFNPWGSSHPNGTGWMAVADVRKFFIEISIND